MAAPWASGPGEILHHGLSLLKKDSDVNRRLAILSIDNSVELMIKTYLGLPRRATGLTISRREYLEMCESFPKLLEALEQHAADKVAGVDLAEIEWYHRLRNELYHQGNGLTVERGKVEVYAELAKLLFKNLFGEEFRRTEDHSQVVLSEFMSAWMRLEKAILEATRRAKPDYEMLQGRTIESPGPSHPVDDERSDFPEMNEPPEHSLLSEHREPFGASRWRELAIRALVDDDTAEKLVELSALRDRIVHGDVDYRKALRPELTGAIDEIALKVKGARGELYRSFFQALIDELRKRHGFPNKVAQPRNFCCFASGFPGILYCASFALDDRVRAEIYIDVRDRHSNPKEVFDRLHRASAEVEAQFAEPLSWERLSNRRASRIASYTQGSIGMSPEELAKVRSWLVDRLMKLKRVFEPKLIEALR